MGSDRVVEGRGSVGAYGVTRGRWGCGDNGLLGAVRLWGAIGLWGPVESYREVPWGYRAPWKSHCSMGNCWGTITLWGAWGSHHST